jgi:hypothetical protein
MAIRRSKGRLALLAFCSFIPHSDFAFNATASCSGSPRRRAASLRRFADGRGRPPAVRAGRDGFFTDEVSERDDVIGYYVSVLGEAGGLPATPGIPMFPAASFTSLQPLYSCSWRRLPCSRTPKPSSSPRASSRLILDLTADSVRIQNPKPRPEQRRRIEIQIESVKPTRPNLPRKWVREKTRSHRRQLVNFHKLSRVRPRKPTTYY